MNFDTLDKKPKLYNVLIASVILILAIVILQILRPDNLGLISGIALIIYLILVIIFLVRAFFRQLRYNPYSYNTIIYFGFSLYLLTVLITQVVVVVQTVQLPEYFDGMQIIYTLANGPRNFMLLSAPLVLIISVLLVVSNISLLKNVGIRIVNFLGILLAVVMVGAECFLFFGDYYVSGSYEQVLIHEIVFSVLSSVYLYFECMLIGSAAAMLITTRHKPEPDKDFIIILGCSIRKDGTPTPLLQGRVDRAIRFYKEQLEKTGKKAFFITSGGQGDDEIISESACMKNYLQEQGIPEEQIIEENESKTTFQNMKYSKNKIEAVDPDGKVIYSTNNFHVFRSGIMARRNKLRAQGIGVKTKWYFWPNATVREFIGMISQHRGKQILILLVMIAVYVFLVLVMEGEIAGMDQFVNDMF